MKIWATTVFEDKITRNIVWEGKICSDDEFVCALQNICESLDIPTPVTTNINYLHFVRFNVTQYKVRDFVESVDFDRLTLECIPDKK